MLYTLPTHPTQHTHSSLATCLTPLPDRLVSPHSASSTSRLGSLAGPDPPQAPCPQHPLEGGGGELVSSQPLKLTQACKYTPVGLDD